MQLLDDNGVTVGSQAVESAAAGKASFIIKAADIDNGASKALFWAEYVPTAAAAKVYDSSDLTKISYQVTDFNMADANLMAAADAFAGTYHHPYQRSIRDPYPSDDPVQLRSHQP